MEAQVGIGVVQGLFGLLLQGFDLHPAHIVGEVGRRLQPHQVVVGAGKPFGKVAPVLPGELFPAQAVVVDVDVHHRHQGVAHLGVEALHLQHRVGDLPALEVLQRVELHIGGIALVVAGLGAEHLAEVGPEILVEQACRIHMPGDPLVGQRHIGAQRPQLGGVFGVHPDAQRAGLVHRRVDKVGGHAAVRHIFRDRVDDIAQLPDGREVRRRPGEEGKHLLIAGKIGLIHPLQPAVVQIRVEEGQPPQPGEGAAQPLLRLLVDLLRALVHGGGRLEQDGVVVLAVRQSGQPLFVVEAPLHLPQGVRHRLIGRDKVLQEGLADLRLVGGGLLLREAEPLGLGQEVLQHGALLAGGHHPVTDLDDAVKVDGEHLFLLLAAGVGDQAVKVGRNALQQLRQPGQVALGAHLQLGQGGEQPGVHPGQVGEVAAVAAEPVLIAGGGDIAAPLEQVVGVLLFRGEHRPVKPVEGIQQGPVLLGGGGEVLIGVRRADAHLHLAAVDAEGRRVLEEVEGAGEVGGHGPEEQLLGERIKPALDGGRVPGAAGGQRQDKGCREQQRQSPAQDLSLHKKPPDRRPGPPRRGRPSGRSGVRTQCMRAPGRTIPPPGPPPAGAPCGGAPRQRRWAGSRCARRRHSSSGGWRRHRRGCRVHGRRCSHRACWC